MSKLGAAFQFHVKHAADIKALDGCDKAPDGVSPEEWKLYGEVLELAVEQVTQLLRACRDEAEERLESVVLRRGRGAQDRTVAWTWNTSFQFEAVPKGKNITGHEGRIGVLLCDNPSCLVPYVNLYDEGRHASFEQKLPREDGQKWLEDPMDLAVACIPVTMESDSDDLVKAVGDAFDRIAGALASILQAKP